MTNMYSMSSLMCIEMGILNTYHNAYQSAYILKSTFDHSLDTYWKPIIARMHGILCIIAIIRNQGVSMSSFTCIVNEYSIPVGIPSRMYIKIHMKLLFEYLLNLYLSRYQFINMYSTIMLICIGTGTLDTYLNIYSNPY